MITNEKMQELVVQTSDIVNAAFGMGHVRFRPTEMLASPIAAVVLQRLIDDYDFELTKPEPGQSNDFQILPLSDGPNRDGRVL